MNDLRDAIETSVQLRLFPSIKRATDALVFGNKFKKLSISQCKHMDNFNPARLSDNPYPKNDRPRGSRDIESVRYHRNRLRTVGETSPIWVYYDKVKRQYTLLDGAHRIVATYLEGKRTIPAFVVTV